MQQSNSKFYSLMVIGDNPTEIVEKYGAKHKVEPYVKYKYLSANKYQENAIKVLSSILDKFDTLGLTLTVKESLKFRLETLKKLTPFEYYRELTDGMYYDENGNALSEENPDKKYNTCRIGRNFALPLILKDGTETYSALSKDIDWNTMNNANKEAYEAAWELVVDGREPINDQEKTIYESMKDKEAYFSKFKSKEAYVAYNTNYWNYAYADKDGWVDVDDDGDDEKWILEYYDRFITKLKPTDLVTIFECSTNDG